MANFLMSRFKLCLHYLQHAVAAPIQHMHQLITTICYTHYPLMTMPPKVSLSSTAAIPLLHMRHLITDICIAHTGKCFPESSPSSSSFTEPSTSGSFTKPRTSSGSTSETPTPKRGVTKTASGSRCAYWSLCKSRKATGTPRSPRTSRCTKGTRWSTKTLPSSKRTTKPTCGTKRTTTERGTETSERTACKRKKKNLIARFLYYNLSLHWMIKT